MPAALGLLGAIVGGIIVSCSAIYQDDREREIASRNALRQAQRLVLVEMTDILLHIDGLESLKWNAVAFRASWPDYMPTSTWERHSPTLAVHLPRDDWLRFAFFYRNVNELKPELRLNGVIPPRHPLRVLFLALREDGIDLVTRYEERPFSRASLAFFRGPGPRKLDGKFEHSLTVLNDGNSAVTSLRAWMYDQNGRRVSKVVEQDVVLLPRLRVVLRATLEPEVLRTVEELHWHVTWRDAYGVHEHDI